MPSGGDSEPPARVDPERRRSLHGLAALGAWVGYTTVEDGQGTMRDWFYAPGEKYLPPEELVAELRPASD